MRASPSGGNGSCDEVVRREARRARRETLTDDELVADRVEVAPSERPARRSRTERSR